MFGDRVEILSPGLFPFNITKKNIGIDRASRYRNDLMVKTLREFPNPPNLDMNEGVKAMRSEMKKKNLYMPSFVTHPDIENSVKLILSNEEAPSEWERVKEYLEKKDYIKNETAREITGITQRNEMSSMLKEWHKKGLLRKITRGKSKRYTYYVLPDFKTSFEIKGKTMSKPK
ncbi:MAG: hypothetical protein OYG31_00975 [Candidatus Kaiserbacteria bacterium]|nr:hypothetical protein [Candidatus Kaiserbacteria bacterium]